MVALIGPFSPSLLGSELARLEGRLEGRLEPFDLAAGARGARARARGGARGRPSASAHDVSEGGLAVLRRRVRALREASGRRSTSSR